MTIRSIPVAFLLWGLTLGCAEERSTAVSSGEEPTPSTASAAVLPSVTPSAPVTASTAPASPSGLAVADGEQSGVTLSVTELKRTSGDTISLKFVINNGSSERFNYGYDLGEKDRTPDFGSIGGVVLVDEANKKKYFVVRDAEGQCLCSRGMKDQLPGELKTLWARFPAPPGDVKTISVMVPRFSPMDDVPIAP